LDASQWWYNKSNCERFKVHLSVGSVDLNKAFKDFIGHDMQNRTEKRWLARK
jgi:hypothetical protein